MRIVYLLILLLCSPLIVLAQMDQGNPIFFDSFWDQQLLSWNNPSGVSFDAHLGHCEHNDGCVKGSIRFDNAGVAQSILSKETFPVDPGKRYFYSAWIKMDKARGTLGLNLIWLDSQGQRLPQQTSINVKEVNGSIGWREAQANKDGILAPGLAFKAQLVITASISSGHLWLDDVYFSTVPETLVNVEDYFFASDPRIKGKYVGGTQGIWADRDPDGFNRRTYILAKFTGSRNYEVYQLTKDTIDLVYEVSRGNKDTSRWNFRRFIKVPLTSDDRGQSFFWRKMIPGGPGLLVSHSQKRFVFIPDADGGTQGHYIFTLGDPNNPKSMKKVKGRKPSKPEAIYESINFAPIHFSKGDSSDLGITQVLRLNSEWVKTGEAFENYDYAKGIGIVNWRFCESLSSLLSRPVPKAGANVYQGGKAINNKIYLDVESALDSQQTPVIYFIDPVTHQRGGQAEVFKYQTYWQRNSPPQWFVVERDRTRENVFTVKEKGLAVDFSLPEAGSNKSISCWKNECQ